MCNFLGELLLSAQASASEEVQSVQLASAPQRRGASCASPEKVLRYDTAMSFIF
jgi:hypothetical protein